MDGMVRAWITSEIGYKRYPTDYHIQAPLDAMLSLRSEHSIEPSEVVDIAMLTNKAALGLAGSIREPKDVTEAQFSAGFCLAVALVRGSFGVQELTEVDFGDALVLSVADKVRLEVDQEVQAVYPRKRAGGVIVRMKDGRVLEEKVMDLKGSPTKPMTPAEVKDKFRSLASPVLPSMTIEDIVDCVDHLEELTDVSELTRLLVADQPC
jgi:2-methylcitrate dehydratase PrpD